MLTEKQQEIIDEIMDNFDFEKVHKTMIALNWGWADSDGGLSIPDLSDIKKSARCRLKTAMEENVSCASGGFFVEKEDDYISLKFVVAEWDNYD